MRLLQVHTRQLEEFNGQPAPPYAILSHTWQKHEITFRDISNPDHTSYEQYTKIDGCCRQAAKDGLDYVWIDTCCIDKSSSAELSEGINSMFRWYRQSRICYIYLSDVSADDDPFSDDSEFRNSRWFRRGWTLQELLAPMELIFFDSLWNELNIGRINRSLEPNRAQNLQAAFTHQEHYLNRLGLLYLLSEITNIPRIALDSGDFSQFCAAARLAWAADRETTRVEDRAYSLLGLLEVNMPLLYGEGNKAFTRLQEEVIKSRDDDSLLAWGYRLTPKTQPRLHADPVLAQSPSDFKHCHSFQKLQTEETSPDVPLTTTHSAMTNIGMQMAIPLRPIDSKNRVFIAILRCLIPGTFDHRNHLVLPLVRTKGGDKNHYSRAPGSPPFLIRREKLFSLINNSKLLFTLSRVPALWKLFITKPTSTPIYLRESTPMPPLSTTWRLSKRKECETIGLHIEEVISAGYEIISFYPPWITRRMDYGNCLDLRLGSSVPAKFILIFSRPGETENGRLSFAICISPKARRMTRVKHRSALEFLMEQSRGLEVDMNHHGIQHENLELGEEDSGGHVRRIHSIWFDYMFGDVRVKCKVKESSKGASNGEQEDNKPKGESYVISTLAEQEAAKSWGTGSSDSPTLK
ncbi:HET-domain-containing protein [Annulohypoxylon maeteangense]|uniref:HET-domain-containing protein n=1 Tax=Annulohypoxylon maeteangense TaxID=1927788 RepID=UPI00200840A1|nr:HET-domain-containing protein [Annulohypoxylon maeteangense]KAI0881817.1 HET-domain-containing protein [Annulohypoxylon maeteangense]